MDESDAVGVPRSFRSGQGFPDAGATEEDSGYPYPYQVMEPESVDHRFPKPEVPDEPLTREELEDAAPQYIRYVLYEYDVNIEWDRLTVKVDGRFTKALGKAGPDGYHTARIRVSSQHYVDRRYSWERCKETLRHELAHAWQARWLGYTSHGPTFRQKARELDVENVDHYDEDEPRYVMHCQGCGGSYTRHRRSKRVKTPYYRCSSCGARGASLDEIEETETWVAFENTDWHKVLG